MNITEHDLTTAFKKNNENSLRKIHLYLNKSYHRLIFNQDEESSLSETETYKLKQIENIWIEHENSECFNKYDCYRQVKNVVDIENALYQHPAYQHEVFDYLCHQATLDDIKHFISNDSVLNLEFFDYLAYSIIGVSEQAKLEIISSMWNASGKGSIQYFHTMKFKKLMSGLELYYDRDKIINNMSWEGLAGINFYSHLSLYTANKMKYFGLLAATELLDTPHDQQLVNGISRANKNNKLDVSYYTEHEPPGWYASGWLNQVVLPILRQRPNKLPEFWLGFYLRMDSVQRYYDKLLKYFQNKKAA